jgi:ubiquinone/menaquinone biosynthesis C-methylase UbiE
VIDPSGRVSFDRAAEYYDQTRGLPPPAMQHLAGLLAAELDARGRCLEIGVGTGRIALPLAEYGVPMAGIDVSPAMLARLVHKAGGSPPFPLALADATRLPFRDQVFGAGLCVHVLHLLPAWTSAVDELLRVVHPGGVLLVDVGGRDDPTLEELEKRFMDAAGMVADARPGIASSRVEELHERLATAGCTRRELPPVTVARAESIADRIGWLEDGLFSWTWAIDDAARRRAAAETRAWAADELGPLDAPRELSHEIRCNAYDLPPAGAA